MKVLIGLFALVCVGGFDLAQAADWPTSMCYEASMATDCGQDKYSHVNLDEVDYCVNNNLWAAEYLPDGLDEEILVKGSDGFTPDMTITPRLVLSMTCNPSGAI